MDRLNEILYQKVIGAVGKLEVKDLENICNGNFDVEKFKAAGIDLKNSFARQLLLQNARQSLISMLDLVEFNGIYFEKKAPCNNDGSKILYTYEKSKKRVKSLGLRHAYPSEAFSLLIANQEGKLNTEQQEVANDMLRSYGEWFGAIGKTKKDKLIVYLDDSESMEFDAKNIPLQQYVDLCRFPEEFTIKMYSRRFEDLPKEMRIGNRQAQVWLLSEGKKWPLCRGNYSHVFYVYGYDYNVRASRGVAVDAKIFHRK